MKLFFSNSVEFKNVKLTPSQQAMKRLLDRSKDGEIFTYQIMAARLRLQTETLRAGGAHTLREYTCRQGTKRYWGKPATIKQLKKELNHGR